MAHGGYVATFNVSTLRATKSDKYPLPSWEGFNDDLAGRAIFSKIDRRRAYQQVKIDEHSQHKTAIITTLGLFKFNRMVYGLKNAGQCFKRNIHELLRDIDLFYVHMDYIIIGSKSPEKHCDHLKQLFIRLRETGLVINPNKCIFGQPSLNFLGHHISKQGISIPPERADGIIQYPKPATLVKLERFLGIVAYFYRFIHYAAGKLALLYKMKKHRSHKKITEH